MPTRKVRSSLIYKKKKKRWWRVGGLQKKSKAFYKTLNKELFCFKFFTDIFLEPEKFMFKVICENIPSMCYIHSTCSRRGTGLKYFLPKVSTSVSTTLLDCNAMNNWLNRKLVVQDVFINVNAREFLIKIPLKYSSGYLFYQRKWPRKFLKFHEQPHAKEPFFR